MNYSKNGFSMALSLLMLVSCMPIKSEPISFHTKIALGGAVSLIMGALSYWWCNWLPSPEEAINEAQYEYERICNTNSYILQLYRQQAHNLLGMLCYKFSDTWAVHNQGSQLENSLQSLNKHIKQLQQVRIKTTNLTAAQTAQIREQENISAKLYKELSTILNLFNSYKPRIILHAKFQECKQPFTRHKMFPTVHLVNDMYKREEKLSAIKQSLDPSPDEILANNIDLEISLLAEKRRELEESPAYSIEYKAYLEHQSRMACQREQNAEIKRQGELDRQNELNKIGYQKALDLYVEQGYSLYYANLLLQAGVYP